MFRQIAVIVSAVLALIASFIGSGAAGGTPIAEAAGGALAADATVIAPGGPAFSIWSVIYAGLVAYAIWQLLPSQRDDDRQRRLGPWAIASLLLNGAWILCVQFDLLWLTVPVIAALLVVLARIFLLLVDSRPSSRLEALLVDGTFGLYLGWVSVATIANVAAALTAAGFDGFGLSSEVWGVTVALVAGAIGALLAIRGQGRIAPTLSLSWGLAWVAVARFSSPLEAPATATAAIAAIVATVVFTAIWRARAGSKASPEQLPRASARA